VQTKTKVVIIGAGFGGLFAARRLAREDVQVVLIDRNNYHTFSPLLYQVATCGLDPSAIAYPVRGIFRKQPNIHFLMGEVTSVDTQAKRVVIERGAERLEETYDALIVAAGSVTNTFGELSIEQHGFGLKDVGDALRLRNHVLGLFEQATWAGKAEEREAMLTLVVVGGGPTGIETAGALHELYNHVLEREYNAQQTLKARVILLEASDRLLAPYPERLRLAAVEQLEAMGVEVWLNAKVARVEANEVVLADGRRLATRTLVWSAGVRGAPLGAMLGVALARGGRVAVQPTMQVDGLDGVYVVGDLAYLEDAQGQAYPMLIPVAKQQGILAARNILAAQKGQKLGHFSYQDRGIMATIGRSRAVAWIFYRVQLTGFLAWVSWLFLHLVALMGFRNRLSVFINWVWNYITYDRSVRLILQTPSEEPQKQGVVPASESMG